MRLQKRLKRLMRQRDIRVADLARLLDVPYTTAREWVIYGRENKDRYRIERQLKVLEK